MTARPAKNQAAPDDRDAEARALWESPTFQALLAEGRGSDSTPLDELDRRLAQPTAVEQRRVDTYLAALERLGEEQGREVTDEQGRLLRLVLLSADYARGEGSAEQLGADGGFPPARIRTVAAALRAIGVKEPVRVR